MHCGLWLQLDVKRDKIQKTGHQPVFWTSLESYRKMLQIFGRYIPTILGRSLFPKFIFFSFSRWKSFSKKYGEKVQLNRLVLAPETSFFPFE